MSRYELVLFFSSALENPQPLSFQILLLLCSFSFAFEVLIKGVLCLLILAPTPLISQAAHLSGLNS